MMERNYIRGLTFDDVLLVPQFSKLESRTQPNIETRVGRLELPLPIISSPMDTVTEASMASFMYSKGGLGIVHRFNSINAQFSMVKWCKETGDRVGAAIGVNGDAMERAAALVEAGVDFLVLDIAHGDSEIAYRTIDRLRSAHDAQIMSPNVCTVGAAKRFCDFGVSAIRVGVGPGSACSTRLVAGVGVPQLTAIMDCVGIATQYDVSVVADGGIKNSGDIVKALAAGADAVMLGGLLSGFKISAGKTYYKMIENDDEISEMFGGSSKTAVEYKKFRGMASAGALSEYKKDSDYVVEGEEYEVLIRYDHEKFIDSLRDGIQLGFSYLGARNLAELQDNAEFIEISQNSLIENRPHYDRLGR